MGKANSNMADGSDPSMWQTLLEHMPWISSIAVFVAGIWAAVLGWIWKRLNHRVDNHGERIRALEAEKADREELNNLTRQLIDQIGEVRRDIRAYLGRREDDGAHTDK